MLNAMYVALVGLSAAGRRGRCGSVLEKDLLVPEMTYRAALAPLVLRCGLT